MAHVGRRDGERGGEGGGKTFSGSHGESAGHMWEGVRRSRGHEKKKRVSVRRRFEINVRVGRDANTSP